MAKPSHASTRMRLFNHHLRRKRRAMFGILFVKKGGGGTSPVILPGLAEIVEVVALCPADSENERVRLAPPARTADSLLVVEPLRRHVGLENGLQGTDVDADLHRRGHRQQIDLFAFRKEEWIVRDENLIPVLVFDLLPVCIALRSETGQKDAAELPLTIGTVFGLAGEFLAVQAKCRSASSRQPFRQEVDRNDFPHFPRGGRRQRSETARAEVGTSVQVDTSTLNAPPELVVRRGQLNTQRRGRQEPVAVSRRPRADPRLLAGSSSRQDPRAQWRSE